MKACPSCKTLNKDNAKYCNKCRSTFNSSSGSGSSGGGLLYLFFIWPIEMYFSALKKFPKITIGITALFVISSIISTYQHNKKVEEEKTIISSDATFPKDELSFINFFNAANKDISNSDNSAQKELIKKNLKIDIFKIIPRNLSVRNWEGELFELKTSDAGNIGFQIRLSGSDLYFSNMSLTTISDGFDSFLIKKENKLFDVIANIPIGAKVIFSGKLVNAKRELDENIQSVGSKKFLFDVTDIKIK